MSSDVWWFENANGGTLSITDDLSSPYNVGSIVFGPSAAAFNFAGFGAKTLNLYGGLSNLGSNLEQFGATINFALQQNVTFTTNVAGGLSIGGVISGVGVGITKAGLGTLTLTGTNAYTGATNVAGGTLVLDFAHSSAAANGILGSISGAYSALNMTGGALAIVGKASETDRQTFSGLTVGSATAGTPGVAATIAVTTGGSAGASVGVNLGAIAVNVGSTLNFAPGAGVTLTTSTNNVGAGILGGAVFYSSGASRQRLRHVAHRRSDRCASVGELRRKDRLLTSHRGQRCKQDRFVQWNEFLERRRCSHGHHRY